MNTKNKKNKLATQKVKSDMKDAFHSIQKIESDAENSRIKLTKKKLLDRELELKRKQLPSCPQSKMFRTGDIQRIVQHTSTSIFDKEKCAIWTGYVTNLQNKKKGTYINFYFRNKKKVALHRLLYANFKGIINSNEYIKYSCSNKGMCCNINHMIKFEYNNDDERDECDIDVDDIDIDDADDADDINVKEAVESVDHKPEPVKTKSKAKAKGQKPRKAGKSGKSSRSNAADTGFTIMIY